MIHKLRSGKDRLLAKVIEIVGSTLLADIGSIQHFSLDSARKRINLRLALDGEPRLCSLSIDEYRLLIKEDEFYFQIVACSSDDRPWLNTIAHRYIAGQHIQIPSRYGRALAFIL